MKLLIQSCFAFNNSLLFTNSFDDDSSLFSQNFLHLLPVSEHIIAFFCFKTITKLFIKVSKQKFFSMLSQYVQICYTSKIKKEKLTMMLIFKKNSATFTSFTRLLRIDHLHKWQYFILISGEHMWNSPKKRKHMVFDQISV